MSVVNNALSKLAEQKNTSPSELKKAEVPELPKKSYSKYLIIGVVLIVVVVASWVLIPNQMVQSEPEVASVNTPEPTEIEAEAPKPTVVNVVQKPTASSSVKIFSSEKKVSTEPNQALEKPVASAPVAKAAEKEVTTTAKTSTNTASEKAEPTASKTASQEEVKPKTVAAAKPSEPVKSAPKVVAPKRAEPEKVVAQKPVSSPAPANNSQTTESVQGMSIEQVELTPQQLAEKSISRANKAVESNDLSTALSEYTRALSFVPSDDTTRRKLAALYYGKREVRKSIEILQQGIRIDEDNEMLRMSLSKLLVKEQQLQAALSPLTYLPKNVSNEYLALRAGIAQQVKSTDIALESYLSLATREPDNGRWWLGLGIQQERSLMFDEAKQSYANALKQIGISNNSKSFIRQRLELIENMGDADSGN